MKTQLKVGDVVVVKNITVAYKHHHGQLTYTRCNIGDVVLVESIVSSIDAHSIKCLCVINGQEYVQWLYSRDLVKVGKL